MDLEEQLYYINVAPAARRHFVVSKELCCHRSLRQTQIIWAKGSKRYIWTLSKGLCRNSHAGEHSRRGEGAAWWRHRGCTLTSRTNNSIAWPAAAQSLGLQTAHAVDVNSHSHSLSLFHSHSHSHSLTLFHSHTHSLSLSLSLSLTLTLILTLTLTHTHTCTHSLSLTLTHSLTDSSTSPMKRLALNTDVSGDAHRSTCADLLDTKEGNGSSADLCVVSFPLLSFSTLMGRFVSLARYC